MKKYIICALCAILPQLALGKDYFVNQKTGDDANNGSKGSPFATIGAAIKLVSKTGGDTITIHEGTYRENIDVRGMTATAAEPFVIQGAPSERVIITGFRPAEDWKDAGGGVYTVRIEHFITNFFVGYEYMPVSRWPADGAPMPFLSGPEEAENAFGLLDTPAEKTIPAAVAEDIRSAQLFLFTRGGNTFRSIPLAKFDPTAKRFILQGEQPAWFWKNSGDKDRFNIVNHPALIKNPGEWACVADTEGKGATVYFKPRTPEDLKHTQYQSGPSSLLYFTQCEGEMGSIVVRNLEISGGANMGINIFHAHGVTVESCIIHRNASYGVVFRVANNSVVRSNVIVANGNIGLAMSSTENGIIEGNEVCFNDNDAVRVVGGSGKEPPTKNVLVRRNYIHHHHFMGHPDSIQTWGGITDLRIHENVLLYAGQNLMTAENDDSELINNIGLFTGAYNVIFGHKTASRWTVNNNTIGASGWGSFQVTGTGYKFSSNLFLGLPLIIASDMQSDYNVFVPTSYSPNVLITAKGTFDSLEQGRVASGTDASSRQMTLDEAKLQNFPALFAMIDNMTMDVTNTTDTFFLRTRGYLAQPKDFAVGDNVEINGDGVMRKVTEVSEEFIKFAPVLPCPPFRDTYILGWGKGTSAVLAPMPVSGSPLLTSGAEGKRAGSTLDMGEFVRGELLEKGKRTLPAIPDDLKAAWPDPNRYVIPMIGL